MVPRRGWRAVLPRTQVPTSYGRCGGPSPLLFMRLSRAGPARGQVYNRRVRYLKISLIRYTLDPCTPTWPGRRSLSKPGIDSQILSRTPPTFMAVSIFPKCGSDRTRLWSSVSEFTHFFIIFLRPSYRTVPVSPHPYNHTSS